jgi:hypothetical protein
MAASNPDFHVARGGLARSAIERVDVTDKTCLVLSAIRMHISARSRAPQYAVRAQNLPSTSASLRALRVTCRANIQISRAFLVVVAVA